MTRRGLTRTGVGGALAAAAGLIAAATGDARKQKQRGRGEDAKRAPRGDENDGDDGGSAERSAAAGSEAGAEGKGRKKPKCRKPGRPCKKGDRCCGGTCKNGRCQCSSTRKQCGDTCIRSTACCTNDDPGCAANQTCVNGTCTGTGGCTPSCTGKECGSDGCTGSCGSCGQNETCNNQTGQCEVTCTPKTCEQQNIVCGPADDGCGKNIECPACPNGRPNCVDNGARCVECTEDAQCRTAQRPNGVCDTTTGTCGCVKNTACPQGQICGTADDGCSGTVQCGSCPQGTPNCVDNGTRCVACTSDAECNGNGECQTGTCSNGTCSYANKANATACGSGTDAGVCCAGTCGAGRQCCSDVECDGGNPICSDAGACVECTADGQCPSGRPICSGNRCVECTGNAQCATALRPNAVCNTTTNACECTPATTCPAERQCGVVPDGCGGPPVSCGVCDGFPNTVCNAASGQCVCAAGGEVCGNGTACCAVGQVCQGNNPANACCTRASTADTCAGKCGAVTDNCGIPVNCSVDQCTNDGLVCGANNTCTCTAESCVGGCCDGNVCDTTKKPACDGSATCISKSQCCTLGGDGCSRSNPCQPAECVVQPDGNGICVDRTREAQGRPCGTNNAGVCLNGTCEQSSQDAVACGAADACGTRGLILCGPGGSDACVCYSTVEGGGLCVRRADGCQPGDPNDPGTCQNFCPPLTTEGQTPPPSDRPECNTSAECNADSVCVRLDQDPNAQPNCCGGSRTKKGFCVNKASRCTTT